MGPATNCLFPAFYHTADRRKFLGRPAFCAGLCLGLYGGDRHMATDAKNSGMAVGKAFTGRDCHDTDPATAIYYSHFYPGKKPH